MAQDRTIYRQAFSAPTSADEASRQIDLVIATDSPINGESLVCTPAAVSYGPAPVPVLLDHVNRTDAMAGRLLSIRFEAGKVIGRAQFTDAPQADAGWAMALAGCAVSVGATFNPADTQMSDRVTERVLKWRLRECSLVPVGADEQALSRCANVDPLTPPIPTMNDQTLTTVEPQDSAPVELSRAEANRQLAIRRSCAVAGLPEETVEELIRSTEGLPQLEVTTACVREARLAAERRAPVTAGHPARIYAGPAAGDIGENIYRSMKGEKLAEPLWLQLRDQGIGHGNDAVSVFRSALAGGDRRFLSRAGMTVSDLPNLLQNAGDRRLQDRFAVATAGVRAAAGTPRPLTDYRAASVLDVGMVGTAQKILDGGEIKFGAVNETGANYKPVRVGLGLSFSPESLANDDLAALDEAIAELGAAMLDAEALALVDLLEGAALGRNAPDGKSLFHADHANVVSAGTITIDVIGAAVAKLRKQKAIGGRYIDQSPAAILCGADQETLIRQLVSNAVTAASAQAVNPWQDLMVEVDPRLSGSFAYLLGNSRKPLELGRLTPSPTFVTETDFKTSHYRAKSEHVFGTIVCDHRSIIRIATA